MRINASVSRAGDAGLLVELRGEVDAAALLAASRQLRKVTSPAAAITGHSSVLLVFDRAADADEALVLLSGVSVLASANAFALDVEEKAMRVRKHRIAVSFAPEDAPDLDDVLAHIGIGREEFIEQFEAMTLRVRFCGFLPGFAYLDGLPASWNVPRRATSRTRVPRGSFAIAAGMAGFYPDDTPGGWNIVGRSGTAFWDPLRDPPSLFAPGDIVRIQVADRFEAEAPEAFEAADDPSLATCIAPGQQTLVVTLPDSTRCRRSLPAGGAFDAELAKRANLRAGNVAEAHVLECVLVGPELRFERDARIAWEGSPIAWTKNGEAVGAMEMTVSAGDVVRIGRIASGLRGWLAISGGVAPVDPVFAAAPRRLARGEVLRVEGAAGSFVAVARFEPRTAPLELHAIAGPHAVDPKMLDRIVAAEWTVTPALDRTGVRLAGTARLTAPASIPSCGVLAGTVQLHPNGDLVIMGPDHPLTGGYAQPFTLLRREMWKVAQLKPGDVVRFVVGG